MNLLDPNLYSPSAQTLIVNQISRNFIFEVLFILAAFVFLSSRRFKLLPLLLALELFLFARGNLFTAPTSKLSPPKLPVDFGNYRYLSTADYVAYTGLFTYWNHLRVRQPLAPDLSDQELKDFSRLNQELQLLPANTNLFEPAQNVSGYSAVVLNNYAQFWNSSLINSVSISSPSDPRLAFLGVNYFLSGYPDDYLQTTPNLKKIHPSNPVIYQTKDTHPRAFLLKSKSAAIINAYLPEYVNLTVTVPSPDTLVLSDSFYPGWQAYLDGRPTPIKPYRQAFRSVTVPVGVHQLTFSYQPSSVKIGATISFLAAIASLLYLKWPPKTQSSS